MRLSVAEKDSIIRFRMTSANKISQRRIVYSLVIPFVVMVLACLAGPFSAAQYDDEDIFFSYERFYYRAAVMQAPPENGMLQKDVSMFLDEFSKSIYAISGGNMELAKEHLKKARIIWPEYFGTDFLLARVNEDTGDFRLAARYYKSYLNKLRSFWLGEYRISERLIRALMPHSVENYDAAKDLVRKRLKSYGIELDRVRPIYTVPPVVGSLALFVAAAAAGVLLVSVILPYVRKRIRIAGAPEGYWICPKCGTENTVLQKECGVCRTPGP